jgi:hypothetical protein
VSCCVERCSCVVPVLFVCRLKLQLLLLVTLRFLRTLADCLRPCCELGHEIRGLTCEDETIRTPPLYQKSARKPAGDPSDPETGGAISCESGGSPRAWPRILMLIREDGLGDAQDIRVYRPPGPCSTDFGSFALTSRSEHHSRRLGEGQLLWCRTTNCPRSRLLNSRGWRPIVEGTQPNPVAFLNPEPLKSVHRRRTCGQDEVNVPPVGHLARQYQPDLLRCPGEQDDRTISKRRMHRCA